MIHSDPPILRNGDLELREITRDDIPLLYQWRADERNRPMFMRDDLISLAEHQRFLESYFEPDNNDAWFIIEVGGEPVGTVALYKVDFSSGEATLGRLIIDHRHRGRGYSARTMPLVEQFVRSLGLWRVHFEVLSTAVPLWKWHYRGSPELLEETGEEWVGERRFIRLSTTHFPRDVRSEDDPNS